MSRLLINDRELTIKVTHHSPNPDKLFSWEIHENRFVLPIKMGSQAFRTWAQAHQAGMLTLKKLKMGGLP
jgi:hypothetical protein